MCESIERIMVLRRSSSSLEITVIRMRKRKKEESICSMEKQQGNGVKTTPSPLFFSTSVLPRTNVTAFVGVN